MVLHWLHMDSRRFLNETRDLQDVLRSNGQAVVNLMHFSSTRTDKDTMNNLFYSDLRIARFDAIHDPVFICICQWLVTVADG